MKSMAFVSMPLLQAPASPNFLITLLPFIVLTGLIIVVVTYSKAFKKTGQKGAWKYMRCIKSSVGTQNKKNHQEWRMDV